MVGNANDVFNKSGVGNGFVRLDSMVGRGERRGGERNLTQHKKIQTLLCGVKFEACWHEV